jgi:hypothetical protein
MSILCSIKKLLVIYNILPTIRFDSSVLDVRYIHNRHFLPFRRVDLTVSASLRPIRSGRPQLHEPTSRIYGNLNS